MVDPRRTLCARCANDYKTAGFSVAYNVHIKVKEPCDICGRPGFEYVVERAPQGKGTGTYEQS